MPTYDIRPRGQGLLPAPEPTRREGAPVTEMPAYAVPSALGTNIARPLSDSEIGTWTTRWWQWRQNFEQHVAPNVRRYWTLWRNFDTSPAAGPGQEWRDRTVIPQSFKEGMARASKIVLAQWGVPEPYIVRGRGFNDSKYEEKIRVLMDTALDTIGTGDPMGELFLKRIIDGSLYRDITGHVFWSVFWRKQTEWLKTKLPRPGLGGLRNWDPIEILETVYDNVDITWMPLSHVAFDIYGRRRWAIERIRTSLESLKAEDERYREQYGRGLYQGLEALEMGVGRADTQTREQTDEPRDTERWPLDDGLYSYDPAETPVEVWLCWDNTKRTLTKIANRRVVIARGLADTPDGLDPYVSNPAIPVPGRAYGDSILNWTGPLHTRITRIARGRMDEALMNLFQQYLVRENTLRATTWFWRPGGIAQIQQTAQERPIGDNIYLVPRRPLPPEAYNEEIAAQRHSEATAGADAIGMGVEATSKSRDVTAAEVNQRVLQGASRTQLEVLYQDLSMKRPILQKVFDLLRANMTTPRVVRVTDDTEGEMLDLTALDRPIDIIVGGPLDEVSMAESLAEIEKVTNYIKDPNIAMVVNHREITLKLFQSLKTLRRDASRYVKSQTQLDQAAAVAAITGARPPDAAGPTPLALPPGTEGAGGPGGAGLAGLSGGSPQGAAVASGSTSEEI